MAPQQLIALLTFAFMPSALLVQGARIRARKSGLSAHSDTSAKSSSSMPAVIKIPDLAIRTDSADILQSNMPTRSSYTKASDFHTPGSAVRTNSTIISVPIGIGMQSNGSANATSQVDSAGLLKDSMLHSLAEANSKVNLRSNLSSYATAQTYLTGFLKASMLHSLAQAEPKMSEQATQFLTVLTVLFGVPSFLAFGMLRYEARKVEAMQRIKAERTNLHNAMDNTIYETQAALAKSEMKNAKLAQGMFKDKKKDFLKFLKDVRKEQEPILVAPFRRYVEQWLAIFEECSRDPLRRPALVIKPRELDECKTMAEIVDLLEPRLRNVTLELVPTDMKASLEDAVKRIDAVHDVEGHCTWCECRCATTLDLIFATVSDSNPGDTHEEFAALFPMTLLCCCLKVKLISRTHLLFIVTALFAIPLAYIHFILRDYACLSFVFLVEVLCVYALISFEGKSHYAAMEKDEEHVLGELAKLERGSVIVEMVGNFQKLTVLWLHRTTPCLEKMKEVHKTLEDQISKLPPDEAVDLLERSSDCIDTMMSVVGPLRIWLGASSLSRDKLEVIASQLKHNGQDHETLQEHTLLHQARNFSWDMNSTSCSACAVDFTAMNRLKNCRRCSKAFCQSCLCRTVPVPERGYNKPVPVCEKCSEWTADTEATKCKSCEQPLGKRHFRPRHHCRNCGGGFCGWCCSEWSTIPRKGYMTEEKVCKACKGLLESEKAEVQAESMRQNRVPVSVRNTTEASYLTIRVIEANVPKVSALMGQAGAAGLLGQISPDNLMDTCVAILSDNEQLGETDIIWDNSHPRWDREFFFRVTEPDNYFVLKVRHKGPAGYNFDLGTVDIRIKADCLELGSHGTAESGEWRRNLIYPLNFEGKYDVTIDIMFASQASDLLPA